MCACSLVLTEIYLKFAKVFSNSKVCKSYLKQRTENGFVLVSQIQTFFIFIVFPKSKVCKSYLKQKTEKENKKNEKTSICPGFSHKPGQMGLLVVPVCGWNRDKRWVPIYTNQQPPPKTIGGIFFLKWKEGVCASLFFLSMHARCSMKCPREFTK